MLSLRPCPHWQISTNKAFETFTEPGVSFMYFNHHTISVQADCCLETALLQKFECTNSYSPASGWSGTTRRAANFTSLAMFGLASPAPFPSTVVLSENGSLPLCTVPDPVHGLSSSACGAAWVVGGGGGVEIGVSGKFKCGLQCYRYFDNKKFNIARECNSFSIASRAFEINR